MTYSANSCILRDINRTEHVKTYESGKTSTYKSKGIMENTRPSMISSVLYLLLPGTAALLLFTLSSGLRRRSLSFLRGPPSPSFILGHEHVLMNQAESSILERQWTKEYGTVYKVAGALGEETLIVADPLALQRILHTGGYNYPRTLDERATIKRMFGKGIVCAEAANVFQGEVHQRQRRNLNPAFSATQLKSFLALFQKHSQRLIQTWKDDLSSGDTTKVSTSKVYDLVAWIPRVTHQEKPQIQLHAICT
ncbi:hypothetical protein D9758_013712 [Tetrapyrgos nigripes]|uniref:Cytochrome P450 n=1 Tax=Tetrapyrgos nigripes TaxID=182062 RepID=A0A8H5G1M0_9AGAR|nr:hypothetical protein D9758_013712 [Tetrapyrgos nigripes]